MNARLEDDMTMLVALDAYQSVCMCELEQHVKGPFNEIKIRNTMSGNRPMGLIGLGA